MASTQIIGGIGGQYDIVFDATEAYTIEFLYTGNQITKNRIIIKDNLTNATVFDDTVVSMAKRHTIPAGTLSNGGTYNLAIQVFYLNDLAQEVADTLSDTALIKCYSVPVVTFTNMLAIIRNATYDFDVQYAQAETDYLDSYRARLYDHNGMLLYETSTVYPASSALPYSFAVRIANLLDGEMYSIECVAVSVAGVTATTGRVSFAVAYEKPPNYSMLYVDNQPRMGAVRLASNIKVLDGTTLSGNDPVYIDDSKIDLTQDAVDWDGLTDATGDFQVLLEAESLTPYKILLTLSNGVHEIVLKTMQGLLYGEDGQRFYLVLTVTSDVANYMVVSESIDPPAADDQYLISIVRRDWLYSVSLAREVTN